MIGAANEVLSNPVTRTKLDSDLERDEMPASTRFYGSNADSGVPSSFRQHYGSNWYADETSYTFRHALIIANRILKSLPYSIN